MNFNSYFNKHDVEAHWPWGDKIIAKGSWLKIRTGSGSVLEPAGLYTIRYRRGFWHLLTEVTPAALLLPLRTSPKYLLALRRFSLAGKSHGTFPYTDKILQKSLLQFISYNLMLVAPKLLPSLTNPNLNKLFNTFPSIYFQIF